MRISDPTTIALHKRMDIVDQMSISVPVPKPMHGTSTSPDFDRIVEQVFMPDPNGVVSASFGLRIAASNPALKEFFENLNRPLPPESGISDGAKSPELLERPSGVVTQRDRENYILRLREFIKLNTYRPKPKSDE